MRTRHLTMVGAALLFALMAAPAAATDLTWVGIGGPMDWAPDPGYSLEIGRDAWTVNATNGGGVTTLPLTKSAIVRVRRLSDCVPVVRFVAQPGRDYYIRFDPHGAARVEDWTGEGMDAGPALGDPAAPVCPRLPDTSTPRANANRPSASPAAIASGFGAILAAAALFARRRLRSR